MNCVDKKKNTDFHLLDLNIIFIIFGIHQKLISSNILEIGGGLVDPSKYLTAEIS